MSRLERGDLGRNQDPAQFSAAETSSIGSQPPDSVNPIENLKVAVSDEDIAKCRRANLERRIRSGELIIPPPKPTRPYRRRSQAELVEAERRRDTSTHEVLTIAPGTRAARAWCSLPECGSKATVLVVQKMIARTGKPHTHRRFYCPTHLIKQIGAIALSLETVILTEERINAEFPPEIYNREKKPRGKNHQRQDDHEADAQVES